MHILKKLFPSLKLPTNNVQNVFLWLLIKCRSNTLRTFPMSPNGCQCPVPLPSSISGCQRNRCPGVSLPDRLFPPAQVLSMQQHDSSISTHTIHRPHARHIQIMKELTKQINQGCFLQTTRKIYPDYFTFPLRNTALRVQKK